METLNRHLHTKQKTYRYTPVDKLVEALVWILGNCRYMKDETRQYTGTNFGYIQGKLARGYQIVTAFLTGRQGRFAIDGLLKSGKPNSCSGECLLAGAPNRSPDRPAPARGGMGGAHPPVADGAAARSRRSSGRLRKRSSSSSGSITGCAST